MPSRCDGLRNERILKNLYQGTKEAEKEISEAHLEDRDKQFLRQLQSIIQQNLSDREFGVEDMGLFSKKETIFKEKNKELSLQIAKALKEAGFKGVS